MKKVILSHAGVQYSYESAEALNEIGALERFYTTAYYHEERVPRFLFKRRLFRRSGGRLPKELIHSNPYPEFFRRAGGFLLGRNYFTRNVLLHWGNRLFDYFVKEKLGRIAFDVFIGLSGSALFSLRQAKKLGKTAILDQHDIHYSLAAKLLGEEMRLAPEFSKTIPYWPPLERYLECLKEEMEVADFIMVPSTFSLRSHLEAGIPKNKLILMPHATRPRRDSLSEKRRDDGKFRLLFAGSITGRKGIKYLLEAVKELNLPDIELTLIGDIVGDSAPLGPYKGYFKRVGYMEAERLKSYFEKSDAFVLPSIYDAFGLSALDAMFAGLPVIVSENTAAGTDIVREGIDGYVVPIRNVKILKDRIMRLRNDKNMRHAMGASGKRRALQFNRDSYKNRMKDFLAKL